MQEITIKRPDDFHVHFRDGDIMKTVVPAHSIFNRCLVMPNVPKITTNELAGFYYHSLKEICNNINYVMTIMLQDNMPSNFMTTLKLVKACKLYPKGVTTGSQHGVSDVKALAPIFELMQKRNLILCIHAEEPTAPILEREIYYLKNQVSWIIKHFPGLKVVIEHISTDYAINFVKNASVNVAATITAHHLNLTLDDLLSGGLHPHNFCYPVVKTIENRTALINTVLFDVSGKFFFGSDTAPHYKHKKESYCCAAGIFMPGTIAMSLLIDLFNQPSGMSNYYTKQLENFTSIYGARFYGYPITDETVTFINEPWTVPEEYVTTNSTNGIVPFMAGQQMNWKLKKD